MLGMVLNCSFPSLFDWAIVNVPFHFPTSYSKGDYSPDFPEDERVGLVILSPYLAIPSETLLPSPLLPSLPSPHVLPHIGQPHRACQPSIKYFNCFFRGGRKPSIRKLVNKQSGISAPVGIPPCAKNPCIRRCLNSPALSPTFCWIANTLFQSKVGGFSARWIASYSLSLAPSLSWSVHAAPSSAGQSASLLTSLHTVGERTAWHCMPGLVI